MRRQLLPPARRRIKVIVNDRITAYIQSLDAGNGPLLDSIEEEALADCVPIIRRETSAFLKTLIALKRPQSILEVGTAVGYSALLMSRVMPENCRITTIEKYEKRIPIAKRNFERAGKEPCITLLEGDAEEILGTLSGPYDLYLWMRLRGSICTGCLRFASTAVRRRSSVGQCLTGRRYRGIPLCGRAPQPDDPYSDARLFI